MRPRYAIVLALAALAGCGGSDDGPARKRAEGISPAQWSSRVEQLCEENATRAERGVLRLTREARAEGIGRREFVARVLELSAEQGSPAVERLAAIPPPRGREQKADRFIDGLSEVLPQYRRSAQALRSRDAAAASEANAALLEAAVPLRALARELDIEACIPSSPTR
jgi:hypothetical protein